MRSLQLFTLISRHRRPKPIHPSLIRSQRSHFAGIFCALISLVGSATALVAQTARPVVVSTPQITNYYPASGGLAVDAAGNYYSSNQSAIWRLDAAQGSYPVQLAGGTSPLDAVTGLNLSPTGAFVFISRGQVYRMSGAGSTVAVAGVLDGYGYLDGPAATARFNGPQAVVGDVAGNLYVADTYNYVIRKITTDGYVFTLAGQAGTSGTSDGNASLARFSQPRAMALDQDGSLVVIDGQSLRRVSPTGDVTTLVSNLSLQAIVRASDGNFYVVANKTLSQVTPSGQVTRIAGDPSDYTSSRIDGVGSQIRLYAADAITTMPDGSLLIDDAGIFRRVTLDNSPLAPVIGIAPRGSTALVGSSATLTVTAYATPAPVYQWNKDGIPLLGRTGATLPLTNLGTGDSGSYTVTVTNALGSVTSAAATLNVVTVAANDAFAGRVALTTAPVSAATNFIATTRETGEPVIDAAADGGSLWWSWTAPATGFATFDASSSTAGAVLGVYTGTSVDALTAVAGAPAYAATNSAARRTIAVTAGATYQVAVERLSAATPGEARLTINYALIVSTLAGTPGQYGQTNATGAAATFQYPNGVVRDSSGNIFVADGSLIRKITPAGVVTTFASGFGQPRGMAIDASNNIYVADGHWIRKITAAGSVSLLAGSADISGYTDGTGSAARFYYPRAVAVDASGNVYVADTYNNTIRKITSAGVTTTLAGSPTQSGYLDGTGSAARFYSPTAVALTGSTLYVADGITNATIRAVNITTGEVTTRITQAELGGSVTSLAADSAGNLYCGLNSKILRLTPNGSLNTFLGGNTVLNNSFVAGDGPLASFSYVSGIFTDASGSSFWFTSANSVLRALASSQAVAPMIFTQPLTKSVAAGTTATLSVTAFGGPTVSYQWKKGETDLPGQTGPVLTLPNASVSDDGDYTVVLSNPSGSVTSAVSTLTVVPLAANDSFAAAVTLSGASILATGNNYGAGTEAGEPALPGTPAGKTVWWTWTAPSAGTIVADAGGSTIKVSLGVYSGSALSSLTLLASDNNGAKDDAAKVYVPVTAGTTYRFVLDGVAGAAAVEGSLRLGITYAYSVLTIGGDDSHGSFRDGPLADALFRNPSAIARDTAGNLYVSDTDNYVIRKVAPDGTVTTLAGQPGLSGTTDGTGSAARFSRVLGLTVDPAGNVYATENTQHTVRKITPAGVVTTLAGTAGSAGYTDGTGAAASFYNPTGIIYAPDGYLYVADTTFSLIRRVHPTSGVVTTFAGTYGTTGKVDGTGAAASFFRPTDLTVGSDGYLYVADTSNYAIRRIDRSTGAVTTVAGGLGGVAIDGVGNAAGFAWPQNITADSAGNLYISDYSSGTIRRMSNDGHVVTILGLTSTANPLPARRDGTGTDARVQYAKGLVSDANGILFLLEGNVIRRASPSSLLQAPVITSTPASRVVPVETDVTLAVSIVATPPPTFVWKHDGTIVAGANTATLNLPSAQTTASGDYTLTVTNSQGSVTTAPINLQVVGVPANDNFANRTVISGASAVITGHNFNATAESGEPSHYEGGGGHSVWWSWTAPTDGTVILTTQSSPLNTLVAVYTGTGLNALTPVAAGGQSTSGIAARLTFTVNAGTTYQIALDGRAGATGPLGFELFYALGITNTFEGAGGRTIVLDPDGNGYFADTNNHVIRKITPAGVVTDIAGLAGTSGSADGIGTAARFYQPWGLVRASDGTLYVTDSVNRTIRKITPDGTVTTLAGTALAAGSIDGIGAAAKFYTPKGIALDATGTQLVIADADNYTIRKLDLGTLAVTTIASSAGSRGYSDGYGVSARFCAPLDVQLAANGDFYVSDEGSIPGYYSSTPVAAIREVSIDGDVRTLAGRQSWGGDDQIGSLATFGSLLSGLYLDAQGNLFVADNTIRRVTPAGVVTTLSAQLGSITDLALQADGTGFALELTRVRRIGPITTNAIIPDTAPVITVQPQSISRFTGQNVYLSVKATGHPAAFTYQWFHNGNLLDGATASTLTLNAVTLAQAGDYTATVTNTAGSTTSSAATISVSAGPPNNAFADAVTLTGTAAAATGNNAGGSTEPGEPLHDGVYGGNSVWWTWTAPATGAVVVDTTGTTFDALIGIYTGSTIDGLVTIASARQGIATVSTPARRTFAAFTAIAGTTYHIAVDGEAGFTGDIALHLYYTYNFTTLAGLAGVYGSADGTGPAARFAAPWGVAVDADGNAFVADASNHTIRKVTPNGVVTTLAGSAGNAGTADGTGSAARFNYPTAVVLASNGDLFVADSSNHAIRRVTPAGVVTTFAGLKGTAGATNGTGTAARFNYPSWLAIDGADNLYVTDSSKYWVRKITPAAVVSTLAGDAATSGNVDSTGTAARFTQPRDLACDTANNVYVRDSGTIREITPAGVVTTVVGVAGNYGPTDGTLADARLGPQGAIARRADGNLIFVDGGTTLRMLTADGFVVTVAGAPPVAGQNGTVDGTGPAVRFNSLYGMVLDAGGRIYGVENSGHVLRRGVLTSDPAAPSISAQPQGVRAIAGSTVTLTGNALGNPTPTFQWQKDGVDIPGATGTTLSLPDAQPSDSAHYTLVATNSQGATPSASAAVEILPLPVNDGFNARYTILGDANALAAYNYAATAEPAEPAHAGAAAQHSTWFTWTAPASGDVFIDTIGSSFDTRLAVYRGDTLANLAAVASNASATGVLFSKVRFTVAAGDVFQIAVDGVNGATGDFRLTIGYNYAFALYAGASNTTGSTDGTLTAGRFNTPVALASDASGNLYVADANNHVIRKITPAGTVSTFAGTAGSSGSANGTGTAARFNRPFGITADKSGNLYVADSNNHTIRKIVISTAAVTTLAGTAGSSGTADGTGSAARFNTPVNVATDAAGNIYVTDYNNRTVRKVTPAGVVTTFAGTANTVGNLPKYFNTPWGIAVDAAGNVYVADSADIRKVAPDGTASYFVGSTSGEAGYADGLGAAARFNTPSQLTMDASGNLYVADQHNDVLRMVTPSGEVRTIGGQPGVAAHANGTADDAAFGNPYGLVMDAGGYLFVSTGMQIVDIGIRQAGPRAPLITTQPADLAVPAGGTVSFSVIAAGLPYPSYQWRKDGNPIANSNSPVLTLTNVSAGDVGSFDVVITNANGTVTSRAASLALAVLPANDDFSNAAVLDNAGSIGIAFLAAATAESGEPAHAGLPATNSLWWSWTAPANGAVVIQTTGSTVDTRLAVYTGTSVNALALVAENDDALAQGASRVQFDAVAGTTYHIAVDRNGSSNGQVRVALDYALVVSTLAGDSAIAGSIDGTGAAARFSGPWSVARDSTGNLFVADATNHTIRKVTPAGVVTTFAGTAGAAGSADGTGAAARFNTPTGVAVDLLDNVIVADYSNCTIRKITPDGVVTTLAGAAGTPGSTEGSTSAARFNGPISVTVGPVINGGNTIYVADYANQTVRKITTAGVVSTLAGTAGQAGFVDGIGAVARFNGPRGIAADGSENLYLADFNNHTIRKITPTGEVTTIAGFPGSAGTTDGDAATARFWNPAGVAVSLATGSLYVTQLGGESLREIATDGVVTTVAGGTVAGYLDGIGLAAGFDNPIGVTTGANGSLYVTDYQSNTLRKLLPADQVAVAQTITFSPLSDVTYSTTPLTLSATASSGLTVIFEVVSGSATINGNDLTLTGLGVVTVRATQPGDTHFLPADPVDRSFTVNPALTGFQTWQQSHFTQAEIDAGVIAAPTADPDGDGFTNLIEYALGLDPVAANSTGRPEVSTTTTDWVFTFTRPSDRSDLVYSVEVSTNLATWSTSGVTLEQTSSAGGSESWRARYPLTAGSNVFFRLKVQSN